MKTEDWRLKTGWWKVIKVKKDDNAQAEDV